MGGSDNKIKKPVEKGVARVPVIMQMEEVECGAACLNMILAYYKKFLPLEEIREACGVSRDGSTAGNILRAAKSFGLKAKGYKYNLSRLMEKASYPCIVFWDMEHFIVLKGFRNGKVYINDPARGSLTMPLNDFETFYSGIVLVFSPDEEFVPSGRPKSVLGFVKKRMKGTSDAVCFTVITTIIASMISIITTGFSRVFMDHLLTGRDTGLLIPFIVFLGVFSILQVIMAWINTVYNLKLSGKFAVYGNTSYFWHVLHLPMRFFSQRRAGDIEQRREANASIAQTLVNTLAPLIIDTFMMFFYLIVMIRYSVLLTAVGLLSVLINASVAALVSAKRVNVTRVMARDVASLEAATVSGIELIESIKASGAENGYFRKWAGYQAGSNTQNMRMDRIDLYFGLIPGIVELIVDNSVLLLGVMLVIKGEFTPGMIFAFQGFLSGFLDPAASIRGAGQGIMEMRTGMERIEDVMNYPAEFEDDEKNDTGSKSDEMLSGELIMKNVCFGYSRLSPPLIDDFNLELKAGKSVAFVGCSGCGKSTLSKIISGLYQPWSGEILFDGKSRDQISRNVFTSSVAVVDQDIILFEDTIANNIRMWDESIEDFDVILAARDAHLHEDIMKREGGYSSILTEDGKDLSGGQRQRMEIARVLAADPALVIMDEATSALDAQTEYEVVNSIKERGITLVVIAHRLSTVRECDEIIVLDKGSIAERGTHEELMNKNGLYRTLVVSE
ncbi:MAG: NHLP family bacteriocin export ABC transporter peptidase/permease/ATPase subunit [Lachnospiraceae bacterium]|nr:NHLP family bacteriocin export ABC transporter peptidase/permease/ATPase subunit [Lachnospiraceae bacterium]